MQTEIVDEWTPSPSETSRWTLYSIALFVVGVMLFASVWSWRWGDASVTFSGSQALIGLFLTLILSFGLFILHEWLHGQAMKRFGATPSYGATMVAKVMPAFYCTSPGALFTRRQFVIVSLTPFVVITLLSVLVLVIGRWSGWLVIPAAFHLSGCIGDFVMALKVRRLEPGTLVEDQISGLRFHHPTG